MRLSKARKEIVTAMMKDTIVEAAGSVLEQHGVGGMTMDRVATTAGLTAGSLYNYFRNKEELLQFIFDRLTDPLLQSFEETLKSDLPAPQKLEAILRTVLERSSQDKGLIRLLAESGQDRHIKRTVRPRVLKILTRVFEQGAAEGSFRRHNAAPHGPPVSRLPLGGV